jgi:hypothetical protein
MRNVDELVSATLSSNFYVSHRSEKRGVLRYSRSLTSSQYIDEANDFTPISDSKLFKTLALVDISISSDQNLERSTFTFLKIVKTSSKALETTSSVWSCCRRISAKTTISDA